MSVCMRAGRSLREWKMGERGRGGGEERRTEIREKALRVHVHAREGEEENWGGMD